MAHSSLSGPGESHSGALSPEQRMRVEEEMARIAISSHFKASRRSLRFLEYVVDKVLSGDAQYLKERTLGIELFGREPNFDTSGDASVRVAAGEVRKRLGQFYSENDARRVRIHLPPGSYVPEFGWLETQVVALAPPSLLPVVVGPRLRYRWWWLSAGTLVVALLAWWSFRPAASPIAFQEFWRPLMENSQPTLVSVGVLDTYHVNPGAVASSAARIGYPLVPLGDSIALSRISTLLTRYQKSFRVRGSADTGFPDLKEAAAILIGASSNRWSNVATTQLRYSVGAVPPDFRTGVVDSKDPRNRQWAGSRRWPEAAQDYDFALVSRLRDPKTGVTMVAIAGITPLGTQAAGELVTDARQLDQALRDLPPGWQSKNLQFVLKTRIVGSNCGPAAVVASDSR